MNNDICPPGTWSWLHALGYSRADVTRITCQRRVSLEPASEPAGPKPVEIRELNFDPGVRDLLDEPPMSADQHTADVDTLRRYLSNTDAELMSKKETMARRMQGLHEHMVFRGQLLRAALLRADLRAL